MPFDIWLFVVSLKLTNKGIKNNNHQIDTIKNETLIASDCEARPKDSGYMLINAFTINNSPPPA